MTPHFPPIAGQEFEIVPMQAEHIPALVDIHLESFEKSFLSTLGKPFLGLMFQTFLDDPKESGLICLHGDTGEVVGFVCGSEDWAGYLIRAWRYAPRAAPLLLLASIRKPGVVPGLSQRSFLLTVSLTRRLFRSQQNDDKLPAAGLASIAVRRRYRRLGLGERLTRAYMDLMAERGVGAIRLGVLGSNNPARRLYEKLGWRSVQVVRKGKDQAHYYVCALDQQIPPS